jgi:shikimate kinase
MEDNSSNALVNAVTMMLKKRQGLDISDIQLWNATLQIHYQIQLWLWLAWFP